MSQMLAEVYALRPGNGWKIDGEWQRGVEEAWKRDMPDAPIPRTFRRGQLAALVGREAIGGTGEPRWHISLQHTNRIPLWEELVQAAHDLRPGVVFTVGIPPRSWWMNVHPRVLHLWETRDEGLVAEYKLHAQGDRPT